MEDLLSGHGELIVRIKGEYNRFEFVLLGLEGFLCMCVVRTGDESICGVYS